MDDRIHAQRPVQRHVQRHAEPRAGAGRRHRARSSVACSGRCCCWPSVPADLGADAGADAVRRRRCCWRGWATRWSIVCEKRGMSRATARWRLVFTRDGAGRWCVLVLILVPVIQEPGGRARAQLDAESIWTGWCENRIALAAGRRPAWMSIDLAGSGRPDRDAQAQLEGRQRHRHPGAGRGHPVGLHGAGLVREHRADSVSHLSSSCATGICWCGASPRLVPRDACRGRSASWQRSPTPCSAASCAASSW